MITTYNELKTAVANWLNRSDLTDRIPEFIANGEARLNTRVRHREMQSSGAVTLDASGEEDLPSDYAEARFLTLTTTPAARPKLVEPDSREFLYQFRPYSIPQYFAVLEGKLKVQPAPATGTTGTLYYYATIPALTDTAPTNWLLTRSPDAYLYAALVGAAVYLQDDEALSSYVAMFDAAVDGLTQDHRAARLARRPPAQTQEPAA